MKLDTIVGYLGGRCKGQCEEQEPWRDAAPRSPEVKAAMDSQVRRLVALVEKKSDKRDLDEVERGLHEPIFALARLLLTYYVTRREEKSEKCVQKWLRRGFRPRGRERKFLSTIFGRVTIWRSYVRQPGGGGLHPLDLELRIPTDGFSTLVTSISARLSTLVSYEQVTALMLYFLSWSPSKTSVEKAVLGFGRHSADWFQAAPAPKDDGEVLVIQIDSKATPTATDEELEKRRGKRNDRAKPPSPRHRGRQKRARRGPKKRRKNGDHSKNGRAATIVVMYTLQKARDDDGKPLLLGPINKRYYASYAPKRHAFAIARREADKRGFTEKSNKPIHVVTDGDEDFERYRKELFPKARHTLDIVHVLEYFWEAGRFAFEGGSDELAKWVRKQERRLYSGKAGTAILSLNELQIAQRHQKRLDQIFSYLQTRMGMMNYHELRAEDLDVATGAVEGAVRHVIAKRFDSGGMRWIRERAEPLLQLRCIELNGDWAAFTAFVKARTLARDQTDAHVRRRLTTQPSPLPTFGVAA